MTEMICRSCRSRWGHSVSEGEVQEDHGRDCVQPEPVQYVGADEAMRRWPYLTAHVICESLGYATPSVSASIVAAAKMGLGHYCEWIAACYGGDPRPAVRKATQFRHAHSGFMADFRHALALVRAAVEAGREPAFASWF